MKRKICAVLFAAVLGLFFAPLGTFAFASGGGGGGIRPAELPDLLESLGDLTFDSWDEADDYYQSLGAAVARYLHITDLGNIPTYWACKVATTGLKVLYPPACSYAYALDEETKELIKFMIDDGSTTVIGDEPPTISTNAFSEVLLNQNNILTPKNRTMYKYSWRELSDTQQNYKGDYLARAVGKNGKFIDDTSYDDGIFIQPYAILGDVEDNNGKNCRGEYYSPYQYRLYCVKSDATDVGHDFKYQWKFDALYYQVFDGERLDTQTKELSFYYFDYPYINLGFRRSGYGDCVISVSFYKNLLDCLQQPSSVASAYIGKTDGTYYNSIFCSFLLSNDTSVSIDYANLLSYFSIGSISSKSQYTNKSLSDFQDCVSDDNISDYGLLISNTPFSTTYLFDITRLPDNATVTISGDSVYDYSITDNSTGDTSTIYNYVTNNYNYPESSGGNTSGGGNNGGDIITGGLTVGGHVDFGGKVDINVSVPDINININHNGGEGNGNIGDYVDINSSDVDSNINDYLDLVPTLPKSFIDYMKDFFSWLPKEIYALLVFGMIMLVVKLILRRR